MKRLLVAVMLAVFLPNSASAEAMKLCSKGLKKPAIMVMDDTTSDDGILNMTITIDGKTTMFEYGGSLATGSGLSVWSPIDGGDTALDDGDRIEWNGRTFRRCKI